MGSLINFDFSADGAGNFLEQFKPENKILTKNVYCVLNVLI